MSVNAILSTGQGQGQVTKGHYIQKSHCGYVSCDTCFMTYFGHIIRNSMVTLVWSSEALFRSFQRRSGKSQVKKGRIIWFSEPPT